MTVGYDVGLLKTIRDDKQSGKESLQNLQNQGQLNNIALHGQNQLAAGQQEGDFSLKRQGIANVGALDIGRQSGMFGLQNQALQNQGSRDIAYINNDLAGSSLGGKEIDPFKPLYSTPALTGTNLNSIAGSPIKPKPISSISIDPFRLDGFVRGWKIAGPVDKTVGDDTVIKAKKGEYVIPVEVVEHLGEDFFDNLVVSSKKALGLPATVGPQGNGYREGGKVIELYDTPPTQNLPAVRQVMPGVAVGEGALETPYRPIRVPAPSGGGIANAPVPLGAPNSQGFSMGEGTLYTEPRSRMTGIANPPAAQPQRMYSDASINTPKMNRIAGIASAIPALLGMIKNVKDGRGALDLGAVPEARAMVRDAMSGMPMIPSHKFSNPVDFRQKGPNIASPPPIDRHREDVISRDAAIMAKSSRPGIANIAYSPNDTAEEALQKGAIFSEQNRQAKLNQLNAQTEGLRNQVIQGKPAAMIAEAQEAAWDALTPEERVSIGKAYLKPGISDDNIKWLLDNGSVQGLTHVLDKVGGSHPLAGEIAVRINTLGTAKK